ncbi:MAG: hypothetical protein AB1797_07640 [bacterium]
MALSKREKMSLYLMVVVIIIYLIYTYALYPTLRQRELVQEELLIKKARLRNEEALLKNKARLEKNYNRWGLALKEEKEISALLRDLSRMAGMTGVRITQINSTPSEKQGGFLGMNLEADMNGLARLLSKLKTSHYLLGVESLQIRPKQDNPIRLDIHLILSIPSLKLEGDQ